MAEELYFRKEYALTDEDGQRHRFPSCIRATENTIDEIVEMRGGFEVPEQHLVGGRIEYSGPSTRPPREPSLAEKLEVEGFTLDTLHMACFVGFLALKANAASVEDVLGDCGLIHEIVHNMAFGEGEPCIAGRRQIVRMARRIEQAIPGHPYAGPRCYLPPLS